ncbi:MAG TPA: hypothetical protein VH280_20170 [Verrucomicrobiae bacterium]|jgi:hypothetical protein|nr:hypothetical protein [Verrucomicrobiae bacterium]
MIDLGKVHEREVFDLIGQHSVSITELRPVLAALGFVFEDDFAWLRRTGRVEQWQAETLVECEFLARGRKVYPDESDFDSLRLSILVSSLPEEQVVRALNVVFEIAGQARLAISHASRAVSRAAIPALVACWTQEILGEAGDICGSESVAILISMEYDKRRAGPTGL